MGVFSLITGCYYYQQQMNTVCKATAQMISSQAALCVNGDALLNQLAEGRNADGYLETEEKLYSVYDNAPGYIRYVYVYRVDSDGIHVVFDLDIPGEVGRSVGLLVTDDRDIDSRIDEFLAGGVVEPGTQNSEYGSFLSAYTPIYNSEGTTVAYACADIDLHSYVKDMLVYIARNATLLFGVILLAAYVTIWYVNYRVTSPLRTIVSHTKSLSKILPENWLESTVWRERTPISTGDEIEELYEAVTESEKEVSINVKRRLEAEQQLIRTKVLEEANKKLEDAVRRADEANRSKTEFFSRMSHDMRTPMNGILGITELASQENDPKALHEDIENIRQSGIFMLSLINDTLDLQRIESGRMTLEPQICRTDELITGALSMVQVSAKEKKVSLEIQNINAELTSYIRVDPVRIRQIVINLLSNSIKFTPEGGKVVFSLEVLSRDEKKVHDKIVISDTGVGMSRDFVENGLFVAFSQEQNEMTMKYAGSGLGLSIVKKLLDMMDARIEVESEPGSGSTFTIFIDFDLVPPEELQKVKQAQAAPNHNSEALLDGKRILLCEDHPLNAEVAIRLLNKVGAEVDWAKDGAEGVEKFNSNPVNHYDLVLMDMRMPNLDGLEATRRIRGADKKDAATIPVVAMTANAYETDVRNCLDAGMNAHIAKPVDKEILYSTIASFVNP